MLTVNLEKALIKQNKKLVTPEELLTIKEYETYGKLADNVALERIGLNSTLKKGKGFKDHLSKAKQQTLKYDQSRVFHVSQIKETCEKYYLKALSPMYYEGTIGPDLPMKIETFELAHGVTCNKYNTLIMAPKESFKLEERPKDPLFFYKINEDYYYLIHKWGNDLSIWNRCKGLLTNTWITLFVWVLIHIGLFYSVVSNIGPDKNVEGWALFYAILFIVSIIGHIIYFGIQEQFRYYKKNTWDSHYKD